MLVGRNMKEGCLLPFKRAATLSDGSVAYGAVLGFDLVRKRLRGHVEKHE